MSYDLDLPMIDLGRSLAFADARGFKEWLKLVPLINVRQAHAEILDVLDALNVSPVLPLERLKMLELLREPVALLQEENAKRYLGKPFPLAEAEQAVWRAHVTLWSAMATGYRICWQAALNEDASVAEHQALCGQRVLRYEALALRESYLVYRQIAPPQWAPLYRAFGVAESAGLATRTVKDGHNQTGTSSCLAAFLQPLLLDAANPGSMTVRQLLWVDRLLDRWSSQVTLETTPPERVERSLLALRLDVPNSLCRFAVPPSEEGWRLVDLTQVRRSIKKRVKSLREGEAPAALGLGEEWSAATAEQYLTQLYRAWQDLTAERALPRRSVKDAGLSARLGFGLVAAHYAVAGEPFTQPEEKAEVRGRAIADFQLFGGQAQHLVTRQAGADTDPAPELESWQIDNESAQGFKLSRAEPGQRLTHQQLLAIQARPGLPPVLGTVRWLRVGDGDALEIGVRAMPGRPQAIGVRATGLNHFSSRFTQALLLPAVAAVKTPACVILPGGWFKARRIIELHYAGQLRRVQLEQLIERGPDFERVTFLGDPG